MTFKPTSLDDFVFSDPSARQALDDIVEGHTPFPEQKRALLLSGMPGTGKSALAQFLPQLLETSPRYRAGISGGLLKSGYTETTTCTQGMRGSQVSQPILQRARGGLYSDQKRLRYEIIDEVDELTEQSIGTLKGLMTQRETEDVVFILTANDSAKFSKALMSRCIAIPMNRASPDDLVQVGRATLRRGGLQGNELTDEELRELAGRSQCDLRGYLTSVLTAARRSHAALTAV
ncbi:AAA family ATPase [Acidovorax sp.]|uniref:AAA family ATPase n=1 Tax=Acidovorax sp. TaxID=1872122 RepID=UPI00391FA3E3